MNTTEPKTPARNIEELPADQLRKGITMAEPNEGPRDPRDKIGDNPTGRPTKSSAGKRRQEEKKGKPEDRPR